MAPSDIQPGRIYANKTGKIIRLVLARVEIPDQADSEGIKYEVIKAPIRRSGVTNSLGYIGLCTAVRFAAWVGEDMTGHYVTDPFMPGILREKLDAIECGVYNDD